MDENKKMKDAPYSTEKILEHERTNTRVKRRRRSKAGASMSYERRLGNRKEMMDHPGKSPVEEEDNKFGTTCCALQ